jgi:hypothetical protein
VGLVEAYVGRLEGTLGKVDDGVVDVEPVERPRAGEGEGPHPTLLIGPEPRTLVGPDVVLPGFGRPALPPFGHALGIGVVLLRAGKEQPEILRCGIDLGRADEALEQHPTVLLPGLDFRIGGHS